MTSAAGLRFGSTLLASFQRFQRPANAILTGIPTSLGALPIGSSSEDFLLPVGDDEGFWIGLQCEGPMRIGLKVYTADTCVADALSGNPWSDERAYRLNVAPFGAIAGIFRSARSWWTLARSAAPPCPASRCLRIVIFDTADRIATSALVHLISPKQFQDVTGIAVPAFDLDAGCKGWLLP